MANPKAFVSYSWDDEAHKSWVRDFAARLRGDGIETTLDQWHAAPGDQLPAFMEKAIQDNDFVLIICTPRYKLKADTRSGGVGYEGHIIQANAFISQNDRKFIPLLRKGEWMEAAPSALLGKYYLDLRDGIQFEQYYHELLQTLYKRRLDAPPVVDPPFKEEPKSEPNIHKREKIEYEVVPVRLSWSQKLAEMKIERWEYLTATLLLILCIWGGLLQLRTWLFPEPQTETDQPQVQTGPETDPPAGLTRIWDSKTGWSKIQADSRIGGIVTDGDNMPLEGVRVAVVGFENEALTTQKDGNFSLLAHATSGQQIQLSASKEGYITATERHQAGGIPVTLVLRPMVGRGEKI